MNSLVLIFSFLFNLYFNRADIIQAFPPPNVSRDLTIWEWCDCGTGLNHIMLWPNDDMTRNITIILNSVQWIQFEGHTSKITWICDEMLSPQISLLHLDEFQWFNVLIYPDNKDGPLNLCEATSGRLTMNIWNHTEFISSIPFTSHTDGYTCFKIPVLLSTLKGTLIAFSEARYPTCDDFANTEVVYKRSDDQGKTWSQLRTLIEVLDNESGECGHNEVIGNIAPVQLRADSLSFPNRILLPYTRNNFKIWIIYSDDDGMTWTGNREILNVSQTDEHPDCDRDMSYFGLNINDLNLQNLPDFFRFFKQICDMQDPFKNTLWTSKLQPPWQFIGIGPSGSLQMKSGRVLVPGYHSPMRGLSGVPGKLPISQLFNNFAKGFVLISDDDGENWRLGDEWPIGEGMNEHQLIELEDGIILSNSRSLSTGSPQFRLMARSLDGGKTFERTNFIEIPQPLNGCQGSFLRENNGKIFVTSPNPSKQSSVIQDFIDSLGCRTNLNGRDRVSLWLSEDNGTSYQLKQVIDSGLSAQTSLQLNKGKLVLLYEQTDPSPMDMLEIIEKEFLGNLKVLLPSRFVYRELNIDE